MGCRGADSLDVGYPVGRLSAGALYNSTYQACTECHVCQGGIFAPAYACADRAHLESEAAALGGIPSGYPGEFSWTGIFGGQNDRYPECPASAPCRGCVFVAIPYEVPFSVLEYPGPTACYTVYDCDSCFVTGSFDGICYWAANWRCSNCKGCPGGDLCGPSWPVEDYFNGYCCPDCDAGECWCEETGECVSCDEEIENVDCEEDSNVEWDPFACEVTYDEPTCPPGESYDWLNCECSTDGGGTRTTAGANPWHETHPFMSYVGLAFERSRRVRFKRTEASVLPFVTDNYISADPGAGSYKDKQPCFEIVRDIGRLVVAFYREGGASPGIYLAYSDDDGETWTVEGTRTMQGSHPILRVHPVLGTQVLIAYRSGKLYGRIKDPADSDFGTEFTLTDDASADLTSDDDGVGLTPASDTAMRWYLTVRQSSTLKTFQSWDDCQTWTEVV